MSSISHDTHNMVEGEEESMDFTMNDGENSEYVYEEYDTEPKGCKIPFLSIAIFLMCIPLAGLLLYV